MQRLHVKLRQLARGQRGGERDAFRQITSDQLQFRTQLAALHLRAELPQTAFERNAIAQHSGELMIYERKFFVVHFQNLDSNDLTPALFGARLVPHPHTAALRFRRLNFQKFCGTRFHS